MANQTVDILIVGGGLIGATLLLSLQNSGFSTLLVESMDFSKKVNPDFDARSLALSPASQRIFSMLGLWTHLEKYATEIQTIHVSDQYGFGASRLQGDAENPLGYVIEMHYMTQALHQVLQKDKLLTPARIKSLDSTSRLATVTTEEGEITVAARLIIAADGAESVMRQLCHLPVKSKSYHQQAIVANIGLDKPHQHRAWERFTSKGPLALLPMQGKKMSLVWAMSLERAGQVMALDEKNFLKELHKDFGYRAGRFIQCGKRHSYPLKQVLMPQQVKWPVIFIGNAAHTLHPVAGQGFNLGLRDVAALVQCIGKHGLTAEMSEHYLKLRRHDQQAITRLTDGLIHVFTSKLPGMGLARTMGLIALDTVPGLKSLLARYASGFGGVIPDLVCEIALNTRIENEPAI